MKLALSLPCKSREPLSHRLGTKLAPGMQAMLRPQCSSALQQQLSTGPDQGYSPACTGLTGHKRAGYEQAVGTASQGLQAHRMVEALKHAFALRARLGDPGDCSAGPGPACFLNLTSLLGDMLSSSFAATLR